MQNSLVDLIRKTRKPVTILFTDIVDSSKYWDKKGDIKGRLMVDQHNRLVFPVIKKFKGKVVKTIGDAVMASFKSRKNAIRAAIGIQQSLQQQREKSKQFKLELRIGVHTGQALIEKQDVFGDMVNVAARVESYAKANEILVSGSTAMTIKRSDFGLTRKTSFVPKGKTRPMTVYTCDWRRQPSQIDDINFNSVIPILARQKRELFIYTLINLGLVYFVFYHYLRFLVADQEWGDWLAYTPQQLINDYPYVVAGAGVALLLVLLMLRYLMVVPLTLFRLVKGMAGYAVVFVIALYGFNYLPQEYRYNNQEVVYESRHLFVDILQDGTQIHSALSPASAALKTVNRNDLLLLADVTKDEDATVWHKVRLDKGHYGWVQRTQAATIGVPERELSSATKFYFRFQDVYALILGLIGFAWGVFSFVVRPV